MFKFLWKLIKWSFVIIVVLIVIAFLIPTDPEAEAKRTQARIENCQTLIWGVGSCDEDGYETQESKDQTALIESEKKAKADAIATKAKAKADAIIAAQKAESSRIDNKLTDGRLMCKNSVRKLAKYPTKVDYDGWTSGDMVENFNKGSQYPDRFWINFEGEWMNGFGNMVPFTAHCKLDMNSTAGKIVDMWIK